MSLRSFARGILRENFGRFVLYVACMQAATQIAGPFFALYMLRDLGLSYFQFILASCVCVLFQALTFHNWGRVGDRVGNLFVLRVTGAILPFVPLLWLVSPAFGAILVYQAVSGVAWAGFNLSTANFIFDSVPPSERPGAVAHYGVFVNSGILVGAAIGGLLAPILPGRIEIGPIDWELESPLQCLFLLSALARLLVEISFLRLLREVREVERSGPLEVLLSVVGLQAARGLRFSIFGGVHPDELGAERDARRRSSRAKSRAEGSDRPD